jgi:hypothetical protein
MVLAYDQTLECAELAQTEAKNNIMEDGFLFHRHHTLLLQRIISHSEQNAIFRNIKGGSQIQYGPYTGGAINMVSQIPRRFQAVLLPA